MQFARLRELIRAMDAAVMQLNRRLMYLPKLVDGVGG